MSTTAVATTAATELKRYELGKKKLTRALWDQYFENCKEIKRLQAWCEDFEKELATASGDAHEYLLDGKVVATHLRNGNFAEKRFAGEQPGLFQKYQRPVTELKFDRTLFAQENPELFEAYRARRFLVKPAATHRAG